MKIGELAKEAGCSTETIRFYEKIGLLPEAQRTENNYRIYNKKHIERLIFIRNCRALEMSHDEIRTLITIMEQPSGQAEHRNAHLLLDSHLHHIDARIAELTALREQLLTLQGDCKADAHDDCSILQGLADMAVEVKTAKSHV